MKKCNKCEKNKELKDFHKKSISLDGYNNVCKKCKKLLNDNYYINNKDKKIEYALEYQKCDKIKEYQKEYHGSYNKDYYVKNKKKLLVYNYLYHKEKYKTDVYFRLVKLLRTRFHHALKNGFKIKSILKIIGCSIQELKNYLEKQFRSDMSWNNHGKIWEIDHIIPCSSFNLTKLEEQEKCFHYTNLQPLLIYENRSKGDKIL